MPAEIPGYYYDEVKKKYFKMEGAQTAPASAAWSSEAVRKRKATAAAGEAARQRAALLSRHIQRHRLGRDAVAAGLLARQTDRADDGDVGAAAWAGGVADKGRIPFVSSFARGRFANMACLYVGSDDGKTGLGVAYATLDEETLVGSYVATDANDRVVLDNGPSLHMEMICCPQMSSIKYHWPSHKMLLTSRAPDHSCSLYFFSPPLSALDDGRPLWLLGETNHYQRLSIRHRLRDEWLVHQSTPAPPSSDLLCVIGTNAGVLRVRSNETMAWVAPQSPPKGDDVPLDVLDQDFQQGNHNVLVAGGRQPRLWLTDMRAPDARWTHLAHASSLAHVRSVNQHQVLVAGARSAMALYDLRFLSGSGSGSGSGNGAAPLVAFPAYRNEAYLHAGWDVCPALNVVAAAHDDGAVALFSLRSGRRLRPGPALAALRTDTPVRALQFAQMPRERLPSLFVGEGPTVAKYSFGVLHLEDEA